MATLHTQINPRSAEFAVNSAAMLEQVQALRGLLAQVAQGGGPKAQERHTSRGKLLPRERIDRSWCWAFPASCWWPSRYRSGRVHRATDRSYRYL